MKKGFTLAEVLITLAIIGIVAALTIPSVISNYQQQEFKTGLKKAVSVLNEAIQMNIVQEGETPYDNSNLFLYLQKHMNFIKTDILSHCYDDSNGMTVALNDEQALCWQAGANALVNSIFYTADGMRYEIVNNYLPSSSNYERQSKLYLHESGIDAGQAKRDGHDTHGWGSSVSFSGYCGSYGLSINQNNTINTPCIIMVDVNGDKKPNPPSSYYREPRKYYPCNGCSPSDIPSNQAFGYTYPSPTDKKLSDVFTIMITDEKAIPFGVVAQRAMYSK